MEVTAQVLEARPLADLEWPVTWRWHTRAPWGRTRQEITVDVPILKDDISASMKLGGLLWERAVAPATSYLVRLETWDTVCWHFAAAGLPSVDPPVWGSASAVPAPRESSGCILLCSDHLDRMGVRRFYVPGIPADWVHEGLLSPTGRRRLERMGHEMVMGMCGHLTGAPMVWHLAYPHALEPSIENPSGVVFRRMEYTAIAHHVERAPLPSSEPWP